MHKTMCKKAMDKAFWENVRTGVEYKPYIEQALTLYAEFEKEPIMADLFSNFKIYEETGERLQYENPYFRKRTRMNVSALLSMIYPDEPKYLEMLEDILWSICDEYTWSLPAHLSHSVLEDADRIHIDLFAAETGYALSEIISVLKERINPRVYKRVSEEIDRRILTSFENTPDFSWLGGRSNWAAVCAGSVGVAFMYMSPERFLKIKPKIDYTMDTFLNGFSDDGVCFEGLGYWRYGFGFFTAYAQHLCDFTDGNENYFLREKVRKIADFPMMTDLGGVALSFSDGNSGAKAMSSPAIYGILQMHYPDIQVPAEDTYQLLDGCARWCRYFDAFMYMPKQTKVPDVTFERYCPDAGWFAKRTAYYGFAAKAGTNGEPHNHNDIANFIFAANGKQLLCDLGCGLYTRQYFAKDTRYDFLCNSSRGHNVPIIDGHYQSAGVQYKGKMTYADGELHIEFGDAYETDVHAHRVFNFTKDGVILEDTFEKADGNMEVKERFVTCVEPWIYSDGVWVGDLCLQCSPGWLVEISEDVFVGHANERTKVYFVDYTTQAKSELEFELRMTLGNNPNPAIWESARNAFLEDE